MGMNLGSVLIGVTLAIGISAFVIAIITFFNLRKAHGLWQLGFMFLLEGIYATAYALELASTGIEIKIVFNHIQYLAIPTLAPFWYFISLKFRKYEKSSRPWLPLLALVIPTIILLSVQFTYFTPYDWYYTSADIVPGTASTLGLDVLILGKGWLYYVNSAHNLLMLALVGYIYLRVAIESIGTKKRQAIILSIFGFTAAAAIVTTFFSTTTTGLDYVLYALSLISYIVLYSLFRDELFVLTPSAHQATFEKSIDPIIVLDDHHLIVSWNAATATFGENLLQYHQPIGESFLPPDIIDAIKSCETVRFEYESKRYIAETMTLRSKRGILTGYLIRFNDMTSYLERMESLDYDASHDALTDILNRRAFNEAAVTYLSGYDNPAEPYSVLMADIDDFKVVNDTYGHPVGDVVLEQLSRIIEKQLDSTAIFARYGGEEFVVLLKNTMPEKARTIAESIRKAIEETDIVAGENTLNITVSIGVKGGRVDTGTMKETIKGADEALYLSKRSNKNIVTTVL
jgi:diguanylate cyclase (GGDEF)-like protein